MHIPDLTEIRESPIRVEDIPTPWAHTMGTVIAIEYPEARPNVVDLVFQGMPAIPKGYRSAETKGSLYKYYRDQKIWDYANLPKDRY